MPENTNNDSRESTETPLDIASSCDNHVNQILAEHDGTVAVMEFDGTVGYHVHVAMGETDPSYWWKVAFLQALDAVVFQEVFIDESDVRDVREELYQQLGDSFDWVTLDYLMEHFDENLNALIEESRENAFELENFSLEEYGGDHT